MKKRGRCGKMLKRCVKRWRAGEDVKRCVGW